MAKIGTVKFVTGLVKAVSIDGTERILHEGEKVLANEKVITGNFSSVVVAFNDGTWLDLGRDSQSALNDEIVPPGAISQQASNQAKQSAQNEVDVIQKALEDESFDPTKSMDATAAGAAASGAVSSGGNNGHTFVSVDYLNPQVVPDSGFETLGNQAVVPEIPIEILILPPNPPAAPPISTSPEVINIAGLSGSTTVEGGDLVYTVTFNGSTSSSVSYTFNLGGGTASASDYGSPAFSNGVTYDSASGQITVPAGVAGFTVTLPTVQDTLIEPTESVPLTIGGVTGTGGILDDDVNPPTIKSIEPGAIGTGDDNVIEGNNLVYTVTLSELANTPISYLFNLGGGTASASDYGSPAFSNGVTYDSASGQITVPAGVAGFTVTLPTVQDTLIEPTESVPLTIGGVTGTGGILDDDVNPPTIKSIEPGAIGTGDDNVIEGNNLVYTVTLSELANTPISYLFNLGGGTASASDYGSPAFSNGVTYDSASGQITVPAGVAGFTVTLPTVQDTLIEPTESVPLTIGGVTGTGGILDDDVNPPTIKSIEPGAIGTGDDNVIEGNNLVYTVTLSELANTPISYLFNLGGGTASASDYGSPAFSNGVTYDSASGQITVPAGVAGFTVTLPTVQDTLIEPTESVPLTIGGVTGTGGILDDDVNPPTIKSIEPGAIGTGDDNVIEGNNLVYTVTLSELANTPISYLFNLGGGTASASDYGSPAFSNGVTYDSASGQITVPAGVAGFTVTVPTINDLSQEALETVPLTVAEVTGSGGIIDNDSPTIKGMVINAVGTGDDNVSEGNNLNYHASLSNITTMATQYQFSLGGVGDVGEPSFSNGVVYDKASGQITVPTGTKGFTVTVPTLVDSVPENTETVPLTIGSTTAIGSVHDVIVQDPNSSSTEKTLSAETEMTGDNFALGVVAASQDPNPNANDTDINPIFSTSEVDIVPSVDNILGGTDVGNIPESIGSEVLTAGLGDRILTGGTGADNFVWNAGDTGVDIITDFNVGSGADVLDFSDLLEGEHSDSGSLSSFLTFSYDSNSQATTITIDADQTGQGNVKAQSIVLQNVDLTASGTLSSTDIINSLLTNGNLQTDV